MKLHFVCGLSSDPNMRSVGATLDYLLKTPAGTVKGFLLTTTDAAETLDIATRILADPVHGCRPIYTMNAPDENLRYLTEGQCPAQAEIEKALEAVDGLMQSVKAATEPAWDPEDRLLRYLCVRRDYVLVPHLDFAAAARYVYPLPEAMGVERASMHPWLASLAARGILEPVELIDRIRLCAHCSSSHINIIDRCPTCASIDIAQTSFIHCFSCGHVAQETKFHHESALKCPTCSTILRHIGSDYDRALEQHMCRTCGAVFSEPTVSAHCCDCGVDKDPGELHSVNIHKYRLSSEGRTAVRAGHARDVYAVLDDASFLTPTFFEASGDWYMALAKRHGHMSATLVIITIHNMKELVAQTGHFTILTLVEEFVKRLRDKMRTTDLATRIEEQSIVFFLPNMKNPKFMDMITERIEELKKATVIEGGHTIEVGWAALHVPEQVLDGESTHLAIRRVLSSIKFPDGTDGTHPH